MGLGWIPMRDAWGSTRGRTFRKGKRKRDIYQAGVQLLQSTGNLSTPHQEQAVMVGRAPWQESQTQVWTRASH